VGWEASGRNGGGFPSFVGRPPSKARMGVLNMDLWETLDEELGYPTEYTPGIMGVVLDEEAMDVLRQEHEANIRRGVDVRLLDLPAIKEMAPLITDRVVGGIFWPRGGHANPQRTVQAYAWALQDQGGRIYQNATVTDITVVDDRATAVETTRGTVGADFVVSAAGPQTGHICDMVGAFVPVSPGRVEIVVTEPLPLMPMGKNHRPRDLRPADPARQPDLRWRQPGVDRRGPGIAGQAQHTDDTEHRQAPLRAVSRRRRPADHAKLGGRGRADAGHGSSRRHPGPPGQLRRRDHVGADGFGISPATGKVVSDLVLHGESPELLGDLGLNRFRDVPRDWRERWGWAPPAEGE
jgi:sarcosine oxidase subunit beta